MDLVCAAAARENLEEVRRRLMEMIVQGETGSEVAEQVSAYYELAHFVFGQLSQTLIDASSQPGCIVN